MTNPTFVVANADSDFGDNISLPAAGMPANGTIYVITRSGVAGATVADGAANYTAVLTDVSDTFGDFVCLFKRLNVPAGTNNPEMTVPSAAGIYMTVLGQSGGDITGTPVLNGQFSPAAGLNNAVSGNTTPLLPNATIVGFSYDSGNSVTPTAGTSPVAFTNRTLPISAFGLEDFAQTTAAAVQATFGYTSGSPVTLVFATANAASGAALAGAATTAISGAASLSTAIKLLVAASTAVSAHGALSTAIKLAAAATDVTTASGQFGASFAGVAVDTTTATGTLTTAAGLIAAAVDTYTASAALTNYTSVTLTSPVNTAFGSICDPNAWLDHPPVAGDTLFYDASKLFISTNGNLSGVQTNFSAYVWFNDGTGPNGTNVVFTSGLVAYATLTEVATASLVTAIQLAAAATVLTNATGALTAKITLGSAALDLITATGALSQAIVFTAGAVDTITAGGNLNTSGLAANAVTSTSAAGVLSAQIQMASAALTVVTAAANLATQIVLQGNATDLTGPATGALNTGVLMFANANDQVTATGGLIAQIRLAGAALDIVTALGSLSTQINMSANATDLTGPATGDLTTVNTMFGAAFTGTGAAGALTTLIQLQGGGLTSVVATGALSAAILLNGNANTTEIAQGSLSAPGSPVGLLQPDPWFVVLSRRRGATTKFPQFAPGDQRTLTFNFSEDLPAGVTLTGRITLTAVCTAGSDPNIADELIGVPSYDTNQVDVLQWFSGGVDGCDYYFTAQAQTEQGAKLSRFGLLQVRS